MSGQFPLNPSGGTPVTVNNFSTWNQSHQGLGTPIVASESSVPAQPPQSQMHTVPGSPPKAMKFTNMPMNGSGGHLPATVMNQSTSSLTENLRNSLQLYMNQGSGSKGSAVNSPTVTTSVLSGSFDVSGSPRIDGKDPCKSSSPQSNQKSSVISSVGVASLHNGEVQSSTAVSVIANASSPQKESNSTSQNTVTAFNHVEVKTASTVDCFLVKEESSVVECPPSTGAVSQKSSDIPEPPLKRIKMEDNGKSLNSSVIVGSSSLSSSQSYAMHQTNPPSLATTSNQLTTPVSNSSSKQDALDVESQLEALFAGIADEGTSSKSLQPEPVSSSNLQGTPNVAAVLESKGSTGKKGKGKTNGVHGTSSTETSPKKKRKKRPIKPWEEDKKKKKKKVGPSKSKYVKEASCDSASNASFSRAKGPVVHIEGTRGAPTALSVVNAPYRQDDEDNDSKKKTINSNRIGKIRAVEGKLSSSGLCGNTLVSRYEANSSDPRWVCVFCKKGCHVDGLGDLFGPYLINHDTELENSLDLEAESDRKKDKKNKRSGIGQTGVYGLLAIPPLSGEQAQFMVYFHENCGVWSPSINLIGSRLSGVQEAVWVAVRSKCSRCLLDGANIGCLHHGCMMQVHYPCGREIGWLLDEDTFISTCHIHKRIDQATPLAKAPNL
ncbi:hypothetical protein KUF71_019434 [Frankliniella fusca]|uniref:PHD-type domain-containing protein n=1 Tax=Frankliniella fusca TaxID=407009 RepID=A0AAE1L869_9NEOP|nr:hypothetical protein KUF71_019434 [Frankliniella fusca]